MQSRTLALLGKETRSWLLAGCLLAALALCLANSWHYLPMVVDDALISYRYSDRFLHGHGLTWNDGEYVEGYSNLLWVLLVAAGGLVQPNLIMTGWVLGLLANASVLIAIVWTFGRTPSNSVLPLAAGLLTLCLSGSFAFWGIGGLETALVGSLLAWALATTYWMPAGRWAWLRPAVLLGLLSITRPDGVLFAGGIAMAVVVRDGFTRAAIQRATGLVLVPLAFMAAQIAFRLSYYGDIVPNTAYAKLAFTLARVALGSQYVARGALLNCIPLAVIAVTVLLLWQMRQWQALRQAAIFLIPGLLWLAYVAAIGGDFFPFHRHWLPALVCFAFALSSLLAALPSLPPRLFGATLAVAATIHFTIQRTTDPWTSAQLGRSPEVARLLSILRQTDPDLANHPLDMFEHRVSRSMAVGQFLHSAFGREQPLLAVDAAGAMPYASELPALDMLGLTDSHIAHHRPAAMGKGSLGHELGDAAYVLSRKPDLIAFCSHGAGGEPCLPTEREMAAMPDFQRLYRLVFFRDGDMNAAIWTRIEDGRLGIARTANTVHIPGFLLATTPGTRATLDSSGKPVAALQEGAAVLDNVYLPEGLWEVSLETDKLGRLQLATSPAAGSAAISADVLRIASQGTARSFRVSGAPGLVYAITAKRLSD